MRRGQLSRVVASALIVAVALVTASASAAAPARIDSPSSATATAERITPPDRALLVSDSAWLSLRLYGTYDAVQGFDQSLALASCRRRVQTSCRNYDGYVPIPLLEELQNHPDDFTTLIVATGYNDGSQRFAAEVDQIVTTARSLGYRRVVWLTLRENVSYESPGQAGYAQVFRENNATLRSIVASGRHPELVVADWAGFAADRPEWFASDGIHLSNNRGSFAAGDYISRKMAFLDGRPCPRPDRGGGTSASWCPDPDERGPVQDLDSLYPIGRPTGCAAFELGWEGSSSWPAPPCWAD